MRLSQAFIRGSTIRVGKKRRSTPTPTPTPTPSPPSLSISGPTSTAEGNSGTTLLTYTVTPSGAFLADGSVNYATAGNGANPITTGDISGGAFASGTLSWLAGQSMAKTFTLTLIGDTTVEPDEGLIATISSPVNCTIGMASKTTTITNDDSAPTAGPEIWLAWGDSRTVGIYARDAGTDLDWPNVYQYRTRSPAGISSDISPLDEAIAPDGTNYLSPLEYFAKQRVADLGQKVYLVPHGFNGTRVGSGFDWGVGNVLHEAFIARANTAIAAIIAAEPTATVGGIIQFIGTNDVAGSAPATFKTALTAAIADMRSRIFANGVSGTTIAAKPYIVTGLNPEYQSTANIVAYENALRDTAAAATAGKFYRFPEGYSSDSGLHPNLASNRLVGVEIAGLVSETTAPTITGIAASGTYSIYAGQKMLVELTVSGSEYASWSIGGTDAASVEIVRGSEGSSGISLSRQHSYLRIVSDGTLTVGSKSITLTAKDGAGNTTTASLSIPVLTAYGTSSSGAVTATHKSYQEPSYSFFGSPLALPAQAFGAGLNLIYVYAQGTMSTLDGIKVNGVAATLVKAQASGDISQIWAVPLATAGSYPPVLTFTGSAAQLILEVVTLTNTVATAASTDALDVAFRAAPAGASLTCPTNGIIVGMGFYPNMSGVGSGSTALSGPNGTQGSFDATRTTTGAISLAGTNGYSTLISAAFAKAP